MDDATTDIIRGLLERAAAAHGVHEAEEIGGVYDEEWPTWYAEHMARARRRRVSHHEGLTPS